MRLLRVLLMLTVALAFAIITIPPVRIALYAVLLVPHFFPGDAFRPLEHIAPAPALETFTVPGAPGRMVADVYRPPGEGRRPAMILFLGVNPLPRTHPQVTTLAGGIARTGIVTVVAESEALMNGEIRPEEVDNLVALFQHLARDERIDPERIGFAGFCIGAVLELLAAADERIADRVAYVNAFSVYASARDVLRAILTETQVGPTGPEPWTPSDLTRTVFRRHLLDSLPAADRDALARALAAAESGGLSPAAPAGLGPSATTLYQLFEARDPAQVDRLLAAVPAEYFAPLDRLSPERTAPRLRGRIFLMHDVSDSYLPVSGARRLATLLPPETRAVYTEFRLFQHVVPGGADNPLLFAGEMLKLFGHINAVLQYAHVG